MKIGERIRKFKQRLSKRGVTMLELVLAMGLLFVSAGGVMTVLVAGVRYPRNNQHMVVRDGLVKLKLDELLKGSVPPVFSGGYNPYPGNPDYEFRVDTSPAAFDPNGSSWVTVTVRGPIPIQVESALSGLYVKPSGSGLFSAYGCNACHTLGGTGGTSAPNLSMAALTAGMTGRNGAGLPGPALTLDQYVEESVRQPNNYAVPGFTPLMGAYDAINDMPDEDLKTLTNYLKTFP